jgi:serine/threonine protein kinase
MNAQEPLPPIAPSPANGPGAGLPAAGALPPSVPDYELIRRIGGGAYGDVWLARSATGVLRAVKVVWRDTFEDDRPFQREFEGLQRFERISREHPSQLALFHVGRNEAERYFYYVMELADAVERRGEDGRLKTEDSKDPERGTGHLPSSIVHPQDFEPHTLRADLGHGRLPAARVLEIGLALTEALGHLHRHGLIHRDVKPSNVIFVNGRPKLADIGLVTDASDRCSIVGTEGYLPPEGPGTLQADIFALGKVLYEGATGLDRREFPKLPEALRIWPDATRVFELNEIILKACAQDSKSRYLTCDELHADLALLERGKSVRQKRTRQRWWAAAKKALVTVTVLGVLAASALWRQPHATRPLSSNPEAVKLYQQAVHQFRSGTHDRIQLAYSNLVEAVQLDPRFVAAYYKMFETYFDDNPLPPNYNRAANMRMVADKLRVLSPDSVEYHTVHSLILFEERKSEEAIKEVELAKKIDPAFLRAHGLYAFYVLYAHADAETALREYRIAEQIDGADTIIQNELATPFLMERKFDLAIQQLRTAIKVEQTSPHAYYNLADAYVAEKEYDKAVDEYERAHLLNGFDPDKTKAWYQKVRAVLHEKGPRGWWQAELDRASQGPHPDPYWMATLNARLGNTNDVFSFLDQAYKEHNGSMMLILQHCCFDPFHDDPRFGELLLKIGITKVKPPRKQ